MVQTLTPKQRAFVAFIINGETQTDAFLHAGYQCPDREQARRRASALIRKSPAVSEALKKHSETVRAAQERAIERQADNLADIWSPMDSLNGLKYIASAALSCVKCTKVDAEGQTIETVDSKAAGVARDAIESINKLMGYEGISGASGSTITVQLGDAEQYAV